MPGMNTGLGANNPTIVSAFFATLLHQGLIVLLIIAVIAVTWNVLWTLYARRTRARGAALLPADVRVARPEPVARRLLRVSFGLIWLFDGILQGQASMPLGMVPQGVEPTASASPTWVQHVVNAGTTVWTYHPISAATAAVWIQCGIGLWLIVSPRGIWSRLGGAASVGWGLVVWVFGEAFGGIFAPGLSWLFGAPGAVLFYCAAGALIALPERRWSTPRLGRIVLRVMGLFFVGMAVLQAWPGRGSWQGQSPSGTGSLAAMVTTMSQTPQPHFLSSWLTAFGGFVGSHGWGVNLFVVVALATIGVAFLTAAPRLVRAATVAGVALCLATWVLVQDLGFMGGVGTDPNSMIPMALVFVAGYLAITRLPAATPANDTVVPISLGAPDQSWWRRIVTSPVDSLRWGAALCALGIILVGTVPMASAAANPNADPILIQSIDGTPGTVDTPAPAFHLRDQYGKSVSLSDLRGKVVALTFLDDVCTSVCPIIAQEFRAADMLLGSASRHVELVAVNANPRFVAPDYLVAFDDQERLEHVANWLYLTGSLSALEHVWKSYGVQVEYLPAGAMIGHGLYASVIDASGHTRWVYSADPGPGTNATQSSFSEMLATEIERVLPPS